METVNKVTEAKKESKKANFANLQKLAESVKITESTSAGSKEIYKISELSEKERKAFRREMRNKLNNWSIAVVQGLKANNTEKIEKVYNEFMPIYKAKFVSNDFTLASIRTNVKHESDKVNLELFISSMKLINETK